MEYLVIKQEIHSQRIMIEAESRTDAKTRVLGGEGAKDGPLVFRHNYNSHKWAITLLNPPKEEM